MCCALSCPIAAATHGLFTEDANVRLAEPALDELLVTDSVPPFRLTDPAVRKKLTILDVGPLFAEAARRIHENGSLVDLLGS